MDIFKRKKKTPELLMVSEEFCFAMDYVKRYLEREPDTKHKIVFLDFILNIVKKDLKYDLLSFILYNKEHFERKFHYPLPHYYCDEKGNETLIKELGITKIDLAKDYVLVLPWHRERLYRQIINIKFNNFVYDTLNHFGYYYPYLDLCYVYNGTHSISSGIIHKKGTIEVTAYDITELFPFIYTDGRSWYNTYNGNKRGDLVDFRLGIIYEVAKIKFGLENLML